MDNPTDTNQASELFELCKKVYDLTKWETDELLSHRGLVRVPLYTSDYLLEKLPKFSPFAKDAYLTVMEKQTPHDKREDFYWTAGYFTGMGWGHTGQSDTPLKALLKLTIALSEAGELK